jgi:hypothetical protein
LRAVVAPERLESALVAKVAMEGAERPDTLLTWNAPGVVLSGVPHAAELLEEALPRRLDAGLGVR